MGDYRCVRDKLTSFLSNISGSATQTDAGIMLALVKKEDLLATVRAD